MTSDRMNMILFMPETLRADAVFGPDGATACTPRMDALAGEGTRFGNCFVQHTVCSPSRCSMFTGLYPHTLGHRTLTHLLRPHERGLFRDLKEAGYVVHAYGKNDLVAAESVPLHFDSVRMTAKMEPGSMKPWPWYPEGHPHHNSFYYGRRECPDGECHDHDWACVQSTLNFLDADHDAPFCLYLPLAAAHPAYLVEEPWFSQHDRSKVPAPIPPVLEGRRSYARHIREAYGLEDLTETDFREIKATYYGMISRLDYQLGLLVDKLKERGLYDRTAIFVFSDHGDYTGDYGLVEKWWTGFEDCLIHTPLVARIPGYSPTPERKSLVEMVDLYPTLCEVAGIEPRHRHFGKSLLPLMEPAAADSHRDAVFAEGGHGLDEPYCLESITPRAGKGMFGIYDEKRFLPERDPLVMAKALMVRTERYKYVYSPAESDELYDLHDDPNETRNLIARPGMESIHREMKDRLLEWMLWTGDMVPYERDPRGF